MKLRACLFPLALVGVAVGFACPAWFRGGRGAEQVRAATEGLPEPAQEKYRLVGAGSCASAACHNGNFVRGPTGSEFTTWMKRDKHAHAYQVLFDEQSRRIEANLSGKSMEEARPERNSLCLNCHVYPHLDKTPQSAAFFLGDGVGCESCHGPAEKWLGVHHLHSTTLEEKRRLGMKDTASLVGRVEACVKCHVGAPGMEVNHDLIAAGHPRLNFEFTAFHASMPHHWPNAKDRDPRKNPRGRADFEARAWAAGQLVTARAALELLADRAQDTKKPWPEFAEHDCFACHHDLQAPSWRQQRGYAGRKPGAFPWGNYVAMMPRALETVTVQDQTELLQLIEDLRKKMESNNPDRQQVASAAKKAVQALEPWLTNLNKSFPSQLPVNDLFRTLSKAAPKTSQNWDDVTQTYLGLAAMHAARGDLRIAVSPAELREAVDKLARDLELPDGYECPKIYEPAAINKRLMQFKTMGTKKGL